MCFEHKLALVKWGDSVIMFLDVFMLDSDKNSRQIIFLYLMEKSEDFSYVPENLGRTSLGVTMCLYGHE